MGICNSSEDLNDEFVALRVPTLSWGLGEGAVSEGELRRVLGEVFNAFDTNHDSYLDLEEVERLMNYAHRRRNSTSALSLREEALSFMREADKKGDGRIDQ
jgi:Ca2+-binding EF-hand superfamily protein